jgi:hypothetical protein
MRDPRLFVCLSVCLSVCPRPATLYDSVAVWTFPVLQNTPKTAKGRVRSFFLSQQRVLVVSYAEGSRPPTASDFHVPIISLGDPISPAVTISSVCGTIFCHKIPVPVLIVLFSESGSLYSVSNPPLIHSQLRLAHPTGISMPNDHSRKILKLL